MRSGPQENAEGQGRSAP